MFPWVHGFHWNAGHIVFLTLFGIVALVIAVTVTMALWRAGRDLRRGKAGHIRWHEDFHDLPHESRACRHEITGEMKGRECQMAFDCRACQTHQQWVQLHPVAETLASQPLGLSYPTQRLYHRGHTWVEPQPDGTLLVGLDDFARCLVGRPDSVQAPAPGDRLEANAPAWLVQRKGTSGRILAPVDGKVIESRGDFELRVQPPQSGADLRHLLRGAEVLPWLSREMERLQMAMSIPVTGPSLADGGVLVDDLPANHPQADWDAVWGNAFLEP